MSADERRHGPVELAELPGTRGYDVEGEVEQEPAHHPRCGCFTCIDRRNPQAKHVHRKVSGAPYTRTGACGVSVGVEAVDAISGPRFANEGEAVTCPACLAKP